jgi:glutathione S-transferase
MQMSPIQQSSPIKLYMVGSFWGVPFRTAAPFPLKLETWLRMTGLRYEVATENNTGKGPKRKTPWIVDGDRCMGDSELIIAYLKDRYGVDPNEGISATDRAIATAWHRTFEEHYHQAFEHHLFLGPGAEERLVEMLATLPVIARPLVRAVFTKQLRKQLFARGVTRHDETTILAMGKADLDAASVFLGDKPYFLGDTPRTIDACVFGFLGASVYVRGDNPLFRHAASLENLRAYTERMRARYFPETLTVSASRPGSAHREVAAQA